ncbi:hypothetical protein L208DRAFT_1232533, partial [Tricholoma matsutake]
KLDKLKSNYKEWCEEITIALSLNGLYDYVAGTITAPATSETRALINWKANSCLAYTFLASSIVPSECPFISMEKDMTANWEALCKQHQNEGPARQVQLLITTALTIQCTTETPLPEMADKICALIDCMFAMGDIKPDLLCCIALLNSLSDNFPHAHSIISRDITASTKESPYTSKDICSFLENEQSLLENDHCMDPWPSVALTTHIKSTRLFNAPVCGNPNCKKMGHLTKYCIKTGGGMCSKLGGRLWLSCNTNMHNVY